MSDLPTREGFGRRGKLSGAEWDAFSRKARRIVRMGRGETKAIKRQFNKRSRLKSRRELKDI